VRWLPLLAATACQPSLVPLYFAVAGDSDTVAPQQRDALPLHCCQVFELASLFPTEPETAGAASVHVPNNNPSSLLLNKMEAESGQAKPSEVVAPVRPMFGRAVRYQTANHVATTNVQPAMTPERPAQPGFQAVDGLSSTPFVPATKSSAAGIAGSPTLSPAQPSKPALSAVDSSVTISKALKFDETLAPVQVATHIAVPHATVQRRPWLPRIFTRTLTAGKAEDRARTPDVHPIHLPQLVPRQPQEPRGLGPPPPRRGRRWVDSSFMGGWFKVFRSNSAPPAPRSHVSAVSSAATASVPVTAPSSRVITTPRVQTSGTIAVDVFVRGGQTVSCDSLKKVLSWSPKLVSNARSMLSWLLAQPVSEVVLFGAANDVDTNSVSALLNNCALQVNYGATADCCFILSCADAHIFCYFRPRGWSMLALQLDMPPGQDLIQQLMAMLTTYASVMPRVTKP
jgi:hypothetical protein